MPFWVNETHTEHILYITRFTLKENTVGMRPHLCYNISIKKKKSTIFWPLEGVSTIFSKQLYIWNTDTKVTVGQSTTVTFRLIPLHVTLPSVT